MDEIEKTNQEADQRTAPRALVIFEAIRREGEHELERPLSSLTWSGIAAGLSMSFSMIAQAFIAFYLPDGEWNPLVTNFGYSIGFLIVILGRQQLFTENTLTPVLQLLGRRELSILFKLLRLWGIVFAANIFGTFLFALFVTKIPIFEPGIYHYFDLFAQQLVSYDFGFTVCRAIFTGWLIALIIWLMPFAQEGRIWIITVLTYLIGIAHFPHIIVGSVEGFYGLLSGQITGSLFVLHFFIPTLIGNIIGGVALVAVINYAQISYEHNL
jgi:formate/nitrite transporter FocA (FNT family)